MRLRFARPRFRSPATSAALAVAAVVALVPANLLPVLRTEINGRSETDTIYSSAVALWQQGFWSLAMIVIAASMLVPFLKLGGLAWLHWSVRRGPAVQARRLTRFYALLDFIGRWSMLDVFLGGFLAGLVQFGPLSNIEARPGLVAVAAAVLLTMLATRAFDPRLLWAGAPDSPS